MVNLESHDKYLIALCDKIKPKYDAVFTNVELFSKKRKVGEIDVLAVKDGSCDVYEIKCSHRIIKAKRQLNKIRKIIPDVNKLFFFCGESGVLKKVVK